VCLSHLFINPCSRPPSLPAAAAKSAEYFDDDDDDDDDYHKID